MLDPYLYIYFQLIFFGTMGAMGDQGLIGVLVILVVWPMRSFWSLGRLCLLEDKEIQDVIGFMVDFMGSWYVFFHIKKKTLDDPSPYFHRHVLFIFFSLASCVNLLLSFTFPLSFLVSFFSLSLSSFLPLHASISLFFFLFLLYKFVM